MTREERNEHRIATLHPGCAVRARRLVELCEPLGILLLVVQARRTWAEQAALWRIGRTVPPLGRIVTRAKPGESYHNYGLALDVVDVAASGDPETYDESDWQVTNYLRIAIVGDPLGLEWGGRWSNPDRPHFEWHPEMGKRDARMLASWPEGILPDDFFGPHERLV